MQRVVFNAHYLGVLRRRRRPVVPVAGCRPRGGIVGRDGEEGRESPGTVRLGCTTTSPSPVEVEPVGADELRRPVRGTVEGAPVFTADLTYVAVTTGTTDPVPVPDDFRAAAGARRSAVTIRLQQQLEAVAERVRPR